MEQLKRWREARGLSQTKLAARADVNPATVNQIEGGKRTASPATLHKLADALDVSLYELLEGEPSPKGSALPSPQQSFNGWLKEEQRAQQLSGWKRYLLRRVEWCESVLQKPPENDFNNPFLSLDTAIQWAVHVGVEKAQLQNAIRAEVQSYTNTDPEIIDELNALLDRFVTIDHQTNVRVKAMMDEAELDEEDKEQVRLRLIHGSAA